MIEKVLIVDDIDAVNVGVKKALETLGLSDVNYSAYCDDAFLKIKKATMDAQPYDAIICDLSFIDDHRRRDITSGQELLSIVKEQYPAMKMIVFSVEDHPQTIKTLWEESGVDAYVCKDREGIRELTKALEKIIQGERYLPHRLEQLLLQQNTITLSHYDEQLLNLLAVGSNQNEIAIIFKQKGVIPASRSAIEKRLKDLRDDFDANTNVHLMSILKDYGLM